MNERVPYSISRRELIAAVIGIAVCTFLTWLRSQYVLILPPNLSVRYEASLPVFFGLVFGPLAGFASGFLGSLLGEALTGHIIANVPLDFINDLRLNWHLGYGITGLVPGLMVYDRLNSARALTDKTYYQSFGGQLRALVYGIHGLILGLGLAAWAQGFYRFFTFEQGLLGVFIPVLWADLIPVVLVLPVLLYAYARLDLKIPWLRLPLLRRLLIATLLPTALTAFLFGVMLFNPIPDTGLPASTYRLRVGAALLIALLLAITNAVWIIFAYARPLLRLRRMAQLLDVDTLNSESIDQIIDAAEYGPAQDDNELDSLGRVLGKMARQTLQRDHDLNMQIEELKHFQMQSLAVGDPAQFPKFLEHVDPNFVRELRDKIQSLRPDALTENKDNDLNIEK